MSFERFWHKGIGYLNDRLSGDDDTDLVVENWKTPGGHTGEKFQVVSAEDDGIKCLSIYASKEILLPREDMEVLFGMWDGYLSGDVTRLDLIDAIPRPAYCVAMMKLLKDNIN
jgi:hypothetical protein